MKLVKIIISVALVAMTAYGWLAVGTVVVTRDTQFTKLVEHGDDSLSKELYEDAYNNYSAALKIQSSKELTDKQVNAYTLFYQNEELGDYATRHQLLLILENARLMYPEKVDYAIQEIDLYIGEGNYDNAKKVCQQAMEYAEKNEDLKTRWDTIIHSYTLAYQYYSEYTEAIAGFYTETSGIYWNLLTQDGEKELQEDYIALGPVGIEGIYYAQKEDKAPRFYDIDGVARGIANQKYLRAGVYQEGLCPVEKAQDTWVYINLAGEEVLGPYMEAGCFYEGRAAVKNRDGKWNLIDQQGKVVSKQTYADIKMDFSGCYTTNGVMIAALEKGNYILLDNNEIRIGSFACEDIDTPTLDGLFAFKKNGKWGFVNTEGKIVIEPKYEKAKSFQTGLAAVCKNGLWGYVNENQETITNFQFLDVGYVTNNGTTMVSDEEGFYRVLKYNFIGELVKR